jgi:hypothetical protein
MTLVYQAYGRPDIIRQSLFSILTFLRYGLKEKVLVYTDHENIVRDFFAGQSTVEVVPVTMDQVALWRGKIDFVHRVKIEILLDATKRTKDSLFYLDGDTVFLKDPKDLMIQVTPGQSVMHVMESRLDKAQDPLTKKIANFCRRETFPMKRGIVAIPMQTEMWNAGVIGLHESRTQQLDKILELTDSAYTKYQKHVIEQLAVSYYLQSIGKVVAAEPWVLHYWSNKELWQGRIDRFLDQHKTAATALPALANFDFSNPPPLKKAGLMSRLFG